MKIYEKTDPELSESPRIKIAKYVAAHKEVRKTQLKERADGRLL